MELMTIIGLAIKYGPEIARVVGIAEQYGPTVVKMVEAISPVVQDVVASSGTASAPKNEQATAVLSSMGHHGMTAEQWAAFEAEQAVMNRNAGGTE